MYSSAYEGDNKGLLSYIQYILHSVSNQTNLFFPNVLKKEGVIALSTLEKKKMF